MSSQSENPQFDARQYDAQDPDAQYEGGYEADPYAHGDAPHSDAPSGPPYRAIAMVLLAAVVLAIGVGLVQLFGGDDDAVTAEEITVEVEQSEQNGQTGGDQGAADGLGPDGQPLAPAPDAGAPALPGPDGQPAPGEPGADGQPADPGQAAAGSAPAVTSVPVQIFNNSTVTGLAGRTGEQLRESGFAVGEVANMPSNRGVVAESTAFFGTGPGEQAAAEAIAAQLGIVAKPRPADMAGDAPGVIVIVTQDLDR